MQQSFVRGAASVLFALALCLATGFAQIERLTLAQMVAKCDGCVSGRIVSRTVERVDHPDDGPELYFTTLRVEGRSLFDGAEVTVPVTFAGGVLQNGEGVWNSEAPSADDTQLGAEVVVFYKWTDNMGGDVAANALVAAHGGLFRIMRTRKQTLVLGRGAGYAIDGNVKLGELEREVAKLR